MMSQIKNNKDYDYQTIVVKKEKISEIISSYECFGWKVLNKQQHSQYENLLEIEFVREHFIQNKDQLQFLQVNMECDINTCGKLETRKHSKSLIFCISLGLLVCYLLISSALCFLRLTNPQSLIFGIVFGALALMFVVLMTVFTIKIFKKEKIDFINKYNLLQNSIKQYSTQAKQLLGAKYE